MNARKKTAPVYEYEILGETRNFVDTFDGPVERKTLPHKEVITLIKRCVAARMQHCRNNLFHNNSGLHFTSEHLVVFTDTSCFVRSSYEAMEKILETTACTISDLTSEMSYIGTLQAIKAVSTAPNSDVKTFAIDVLCECLAYKHEEDYDE